MSYGKYKQPDVVFPAQPGGVGTSPAVTIGGATRFTVLYPAAFGAPATTKMTIRQGAAETDGAFASRLRELSEVVQAMKVARHTNSTVFDALEVRRAALADA